MKKTELMKKRIKIRNQILQMLYDLNEEVTSLNMLTEISDNHEELLSAAEYLAEKGLIKFTSKYAGFFDAEITSYGIDEIEGNNGFVPVTLNQNIIQNSPGTVVNSNNVNINIKNSFNQIYQEINKRNPENSKELQEKVKELQHELEKENVDKTKIQKCNEWLQRNANWTIPTITQIILASMGLGV